MDSEDLNGYDLEKSVIEKDYDEEVRSYSDIFFSGEHSVVDGGCALVRKINKPVYVGLSGRVSADKAEDIGAPLIEPPKSIDPVTGRYEKMANPFRIEERLGNLDEAIRDGARNVSRTIDFIPAKVKIMSTVPPGRGPNYSGALAASVAVGVLSMNGAKIKPEDLKIDWENPLSNEKFRDAFYYAMEIEKRSHDEPSGYGPFFGLLHSDKGPFLFSPVKNKSGKIREIGASPWPEEGKPLGSETDLALLVVDSGVKKSTYDAIDNARGMEEERQSTEELLNYPEKFSQNNLKQPLFKKSLESPGPCHRGLDALSASLIAALRNFCENPSEDHFNTFVKAVRAIDNMHGQMGLHWPLYNKVRSRLYRNYGEAVGCKLTGGGEGGAFLVLTKKALIPRIREDLQDFEEYVAILFDSTEEETPMKGSEVLKTTSPKEIGEINEFRDLAIDTITPKENERRVGSSAHIYSMLKKAKDKLLKDGYEKVLIADKRKEWGLISLELNGKGKYEAEIIRKSGFNKTKALSLLELYKHVEPNEEGERLVKTANQPRIKSLPSSRLRSNIIYTLNEILKKNRGRKPFRILEDEGGLDEREVSLALPKSRAIIFIDYYKTKTEKIKTESAKKSDGLGESVSAYTDKDLYELSKSGFSKTLEEGRVRILDLCSGKGLAATPFRDNNIVFYLDLSEEMIEEGRKEGHITAPDSRLIVDKAENMLENEKIQPFIGSFDAVINRFSFHDFTDADFEQFENDKERYYKSGIENQRSMLRKVHKILKNGGELQIIDTAVPTPNPSKVKDFYNQYHAIKTHGDPIGVHIATVGELKKMAEKEGFLVNDTRWYRSQVKPQEWYNENQITRKRLEKLRRLFDEGNLDKEIKQVFSIEALPNGEFKVSFPVVVLTLQAT